MQIKSTTYHFIPPRMAKIWKSGNTSVEEMWNWSWYTAAAECKMAQELWKIVLKLKISQVYDSEIWLLLRRKMKIFVHKNTCITMFIVVLLITPQNWEQCKCHTSEEINKLWHIHPMELYSMTKKNKPKYGCISETLCWWKKETQKSL